MSELSRQVLIRYAVAVATVIIVALLKKFVINLIVGDQQWFLLFVAAICLSSWYGGFGPGVVTAILSALAAYFYFALPNGALDLTTPSALFQLVLFLLEGLLVVALTGNLRETRIEAQKNLHAKDEALALLDTFQVYAPVGLAFFDRELRYIRINYAMAEVDGLTPAAHIGRTLQEVQPQINPAQIAEIQRVLETGKPLLDQELTVVKPTMLGMKRQSFLMSYYRMRGMEGQPIGIGAVMVDISVRKQSEEALRESEARFRTMADTAPVMIWLAGTDKLRSYFNKVWLDFTGQSIEHELGNGWVEHLHPDDVEPYLQVYASSFDARQEFSMEYRLRRKDGEYRWLLSHGVPRFTPEGVFTGYIGVSIDISERKRQEIGQQFILQAGILIASSLDYETVLADVARLAVPTIADWCAIDLLTPSGSLERLAVAHVDPDKVKWAYELQERYPTNMNAETGVANVIRTGKTEFVPEVTEGMIEGAAVDAEMYQIIQEIGFTSVITTPLIARGHTLGALTLVSAESKRHYNEADVWLAEQIAVRAALAVDNARLFAEAQSERERFRVTLASIGDAVIATDEQGQVTFINQIAQNLTGWQESDALGQSLGSIFKIVNEQSRAIVENPVDKVLLEGRIVGLANHTVLIAKSGEERPIDDSGAPIPDEEGGISGVVLVFRDVSERKEAERRQQFLTEAGNLLISSLDYETTLSNVVNLAVPTIADWCAVDLVADDEQIERLAVAHFDPERTKWAYELSKLNPQSMNRDGGLQRVIRSGKTDFVHLIPEEMLEAAAESAEAYELIKSLGLKSYIVAPLTARGRTFGALSVVSAESGRLYTEADVALLEELAYRAALAVDNASLYRAARAERERFRVTLSSIGDAVIATDQMGQVTFINQIAQNLTGWQESDALGKALGGIFNIVNEQTRATAENPVDRVLREGRIVGLANHTVLVSKSGVETPIDDSGAPIPDENGGVGGVILVFRDVSERKQAERRQQFLAEAGNLLISSLDYETTLQQIVKLAVPSLADWAIIYLVDDDGSIRQAAAYHSDPKQVALREEMMRRYTPSPNHIHGYPLVIRTGKSELLNDLAPEQLESIARDAEHLRYLRELSYTSSITVPLKNPQGTFGAFALAISELGRVFNTDDLALMEELGKLASLAIENARHFRKAQGN